MCDKLFDISVNIISIISPHENISDFENIHSIIILQYIFDNYGIIEHDHDYSQLHTTNDYIIDDNIVTTFSSPAQHDHNYTASFIDITHTIDDNIESTLSNDQNFGVLHYNDEVIHRDLCLLTMI